MRLLAILSVVVVALCALALPASATDLSDAAAAIAVGESIKLDTSLSSFTMGDGCGGSLNAYASSAVWIEQNSELRWVGSGHCGGASNQWLVIYDEATNTWSSGEVSHPLFASTHAYDANAVDPSGNHYFAGTGRTIAWKWTRTTDTWADTGSFNNTLGAAPAMCWFPGLNSGAGGIVKVNVNYMEYSDATGTSWTSFTGEPTDHGYHDICEYEATSGLVIFGSGNLGAMYKLESNLTITGITEGTFNVGSGELQGLFNADPGVEDHIIAWNKANGTWERYDISADSWASLTKCTGDGSTACTGAPNINSSGGSPDREVIAAPIDRYGVIMYIQSNGANPIPPNPDADVWLYRHSAATDPAIVTATVKESASVGTTDWPTTAVFPLADGLYTSVSSLALYDETGAAYVPAQFDVIERDWIEDGTPDDNSVLHVKAQFQATAAAAATRDYTLRNSVDNPAPTDAVTVTDCTGTDTPITGCMTSGKYVTTGPLQFTINIPAFNILDTVWYDLDDNGTYASGERIIIPAATNGGRFVGCTGASVEAHGCTDENEHDSGLTAPTCTVEESGPMRAVIRCEKPAVFIDAGDNGYAETHTHGYAVRIYAYAGKADVKIDYQLQNSAKTGWTWGGNEYAGPMYFQSLDLDFKLQLASAATVKTSVGDGTIYTAAPVGASGLQQAITLHDVWSTRLADDSGEVDSCVVDNACADALWMDVYDSSWGVQAITRNAWEQWPNGLEISDNSTTPTLSVQLFPDWSEQWDYSASAAYNIPVANPVYWLEDMQHVYKEVLLRFHGAVPSDQTAYAETFDRYPVPTLPTEYYGTSKVTMDMGGYNPLLAGIGVGTLLETTSAGDMAEGTPSNYRMGWNRWFTNSIARLEFAAGTGGGPPGGQTVIATEDPGDYWEVERKMISELNNHPQWMADYTHAADYDTTTLESQYDTGDWRGYPGTGNPCFGDPYTTHAASAGWGCYGIVGSERRNQARDDPHAWTYNVVDSYWLNPNLWVKDWVSFLGEFRRHRTAGVGSIDQSGRATAHAIKDTVAAYRITGTSAYLTETSEYLSRDMPISPLCGQNTDWTWGGDGVWHGFQNRILADITDRLRGRDWTEWAKAFKYLSAQQYGNYLYGHLAYQHDTCVAGGGSGGTGWPNPDNLSAYYWQTGKLVFQSWAEDYINGGTGYCSENDLQVCDADIDCGGTCDGIGGAPYNGGTLLDQPTWTGGHTGRMYEYAEINQPKTDANPPTTISNLAGTLSGSTLALTWTAPVDAAYYYIVTSDKTISETHSTDTGNVTNWWYGDPFACDIATCDGAASVTGVTANPVFAVVFSFDASDNMSAISNVALSSGGNAMVLRGVVAQ